MKGVKHASWERLSQGRSRVGMLLLYSINNDLLTSVQSRVQTCVDTVGRTGRDEPYRLPDAAILFITVWSCTRIVALRYHCCDVFDLKVPDALR